MTFAEIGVQIMFIYIADSTIFALVMFSKIAAPMMFAGSKKWITESVEEEGGQARARSWCLDRREADMREPHMRREGRGETDTMREGRMEIGGQDISREGSGSGDSGMWEPDMRREEMGEPNVGREERRETETKREKRGDPDMRREGWELPEMKREDRGNSDMRREDRGSKEGRREEKAEQMYMGQGEDNHGMDPFDEDDVASPKKTPR